MGDFELILVANAAHIKAVPGRKTDMNDAMWIADLAGLRVDQGELRARGKAGHELRTLMRTRKQLGHEQTRHVQRIQKTLTEANIRLDLVLSDMMGASGRRMIEAMIAGCAILANWRGWPIGRIKASRRNSTMRCTGG